MWHIKKALCFWSSSPAPTQLQSVCFNLHDFKCMLSYHIIWNYISNAYSTCSMFKGIRNSFLGEIWWKHSDISANCPKSVLMSYLQDAVWSLMQLLCAGTISSSHYCLKFLPLQWWHRSETRSVWEAGKLMSWGSVFIGDFFFFFLVLGLRSSEGNYSTLTARWVLQLCYNPRTAHRSWALDFVCGIITGIMIGRGSDQTQS